MSQLDVLQVMSGYHLMYKVLRWVFTLCVFSCVGAVPRYNLTHCHADVAINYNSSFEFLCSSLTWLQDKMSPC